MARGRMINSSICMDKRVNQLSDDTCRLLFTWLVSWADREGRTYGDAALVRSMIFPRRSDVSVEQVEAYLCEMDALGLIVRYEINDDLYILFPAFGKNQVGLRKEKESPSIIPAPPAMDEPAPAAGQSKDVVKPEEVRKEDGVKTDKVRQNLNELNRKEKKGTEQEGKGVHPISFPVLAGEKAWEDIKRITEPEAQGDKFRYRSKVDPCQVVGQAGDTLQIRAPDPRTCAWLNTVFETMAYQSKVAAVMGEGSRVEFVVGHD